MKRALLGFVRVACGLAAFGLAAFAGLGALIAAPLRGEADFTLDAVNHFAPLVLVAAIVVCIASRVAANRDWLTLAAGAAAAIFAGSTMGHEVLRPAPRVAAGERTLRLLQFNLLSKNPTPQKAAAYILASDADVVAIEEVFGNSGVVPDAVRAKYPYQLPADPRARVRLLSRWPMSEGGLGPLHERRAAAAVAGDVTSPWGRKFTVLAVHYNWPLPSHLQRAQRTLVAEYLSGPERADAIVAGDFNSTPWSWAMKSQDRMFGLERRTKAAFSWPTFLPFPALPIDHVYAGRVWRTVSIERGPRTGSDHYPVLVTLRDAP